MEHTLDFLFLRFQLSFHVRERGLDLLKVPVRFGVCGIKAFVLPLFLSVVWTRDQRDEISHFRRKHSRRNALQLSLHRLSLSVFTHKLAEFGVVDIQTRKCSRSEKNRWGPPRNVHVLHLVLLALHFCSLDIQPGSRIRLQTQSPDLPVQILPSILQCSRLAALLRNLLVVVRIFDLSTNPIEAVFFLLDVALQGPDICGERGCLVKGGFGGGYLGAEGRLWNQESAQAASGGMLDGVERSSQSGSSSLISVVSTLPTPSSIF